MRVVSCSSNLLQRLVALAEPPCQCGWSTDCFPGVQPLVRGGQGVGHGQAVLEVEDLQHVER
jgi:hypothetical protein